VIRENTVLVLGAGASAPYGFPIGTTLKDQILYGCNWKKIFDTELKSELWDKIFHTYGKDKLKDFINSLSYSGKYSVDSFLEHQRRFIDVGKVLISLKIISVERIDHLFKAKKNWYQYLYNKLNAVFEDFSKNKLAVITFNYDRSFEQYLFTCLKNDYGDSDDETANALRSIPIVHLHGSLGNLPSLSKSNIKEYNQINDFDSLKSCAENIKIIHEGIEGDPEFEKAHQLLSEAQIVCFLGFGYDQTNLERLDLENNLINTVVYGSTHGFTSREAMTISNNIKASGNVDYSGKLDVLDFLRHYCLLDKIL